MKMFFEMFSYDFMVRAIVVGLLISLCSSLLGVTMVLKRFSMIGDGLSHVGFAALAAAAAAGVAPLKVAIPVCIVAAFLILRISNNTKIKGDQIIAIVCSGALAVGIMIVSLSKGMNTDVNNYMFGSVLALSKEDTVMCIILSAIVLITFFFFFNKIFSVTFDENFAKATGVRANVYNGIIAVLTALTVVIGMKMMGALLISSLIIFPCLSSMRVCKKYKSVALLSAIIAVICFMIGISLSYIKSTPAGASVVCSNLVVFLFLSLISFLKKNKKTN